MFRKKIELSEEEKQAIHLLEVCARELERERTLGLVTTSEYDRLGKGIETPLYNLEQKAKHRKSRGLFACGTY